MEKRAFCGTPGSRVVLRIGAQGMLAEWIGEFMETVYHVTLPKDTDLFTSDETQIFVFIIP